MPFTYKYEHITQIHVTRTTLHLTMTTIIIITIQDQYYYVFISQYHVCLPFIKLLLNDSQRHWCNHHHVNFIDSKIANVMNINWSCRKKTCWYLELSIYVWVSLVNYRFILLWQMSFCQSVGGSVIVTDRTQHSRRSNFVLSDIRVSIAWMENLFRKHINAMWEHPEQQPMGK